MRIASVMDAESLPKNTGFAALLHDLFRSGQALEKVSRHETNLTAIESKRAMTELCAKATLRHISLWHHYQFLVFKHYFLFIEVLHRA
jgi:hypothetical protein